MSDPLAIRASTQTLNAMRQLAQSVMWFGLAFLPTAFADVLDVCEILTHPSVYHQTNVRIRGEIAIGRMGDDYFFLKPISCELPAGRRAALIDGIHIISPRSWSEISPIAARSSRVTPPKQARQLWVELRKFTLGRSTARFIVTLSGRLEADAAKHYGHMHSLPAQLHMDDASDLKVIRAAKR